MPDLTETLRDIVEERTPHNRWLGIRLASVDAEHAVCVLPRAAPPLRDVVGGRQEGGLITTLIDVASGAAVCMKLGRLQGMATVTLRVDFLRAARPGQLLRARAQCYGIAGATAFVRAFAYDDDSDDAFAAAQGVFALTDGGV